MQTVSLYFRVLSAAYLASYFFEPLRLTATLDFSKIIMLVLMGERGGALVWAPLLLSAFLITSVLTFKNIDVLSKVNLWVIFIWMALCALMLYLSGQELLYVVFNFAFAALLDVWRGKKEGRRESVAENYAAPAGRAQRKGV